MFTTTRLALHCPDIHTQSDEMAIRETIPNLAGVDSVDVNYVTGRVWVVTENQDGGVDVKRHLADLGYPPDESSPEESSAEELSAEE